MIYKYVADENPELTTMLIHGCIGLNSLGEGIDGTTFANELYDLQNKGVKRVIIGINSPGGSVLDAYSIFSAMLSTKMIVDTRNDGACLSAGGFLLMGGKKRYALDYSLLMLHQVSGGGESAQEHSVRLKMTESILTIFDSNTTIDKAVLGNMIDKETWMDASEMIEFGFVDEIIPSGKQIKADPKALKTAQAVFEFINSASKEEDEKGSLKYQINEAVDLRLSVLKKEINSLKNNQLKYKNMDNAKLCKALGLPEDSSDADIMAEIKELKGNAKENSKVEEMKKEKDKAEADKKKAEDEKEEAKKNLADVLDSTADTLIENSFSNGKLKAKDEAEKTTLKDKWKNIFKNSFEGGKMALEAIETSKVAGRAVNFRDLTNQSSTGGNSVLTSTTLTDEEKKWNHREWEKNNPNKLEEIAKNDPEYKLELFNNYYNK